MSGAIALPFALLAIVASSSCAHGAAAPEQDQPHTCDEFDIRELRREQRGSRVLLVATEETDHCTGTVSTRIPIASIDTTGKTPSCPVGDELLQQGEGTTTVVNVALWNGLDPSVRARLEAEPSTAPRVGGHGLRRAVIVGCPKAHDVDLLWIDVANIR